MCCTLELEGITESSWPCAPNPVIASYSFGGVLLFSVCKLVYMTDRLILRLYDLKQAHQAITTAWAYAKDLIAAGHRLTLEIRPEKRSDAQNRLLHACLSEISKRVEWGGSKQEIDTWKRLLMASWCRARNEQVTMLPALDGHGVDIVFRRSSQLTREECAELCEFIMAWAAQQGIELNVKEVP